jgi:hypothetical protein
MSYNNHLLFFRKKTEICFAMSKKSCSFAPVLRIITKYRFKRYDHQRYQREHAGYRKLL